jgi:hypothetical protein
MKEKPGTELAVVSADQFVALRKNSEFAEALKANTELAGEAITADSLTRIKTPAGGGTRWEIPTASGAESTEEIRGVLVNFQKHGLLWPSDDPKPGGMPVLRTWDLKTAEQVGPIPEDMTQALESCKVGARAYSWENLTYNQWGTGKNGIGKRCREQRQLFVLREGDLFPLLITAQPGSLRRVLNWFNDLSKAGVPFYRAIVSLRLEKTLNKGGQPYSQIVPKLVGTLSPADGAIVLKQFTEPIRGIVKEIDVTEEASEE